MKKLTWSQIASATLLVFLGVCWYLWVSINILDIKWMLKDKVLTEETGTIHYYGKATHTRTGKPIGSITVPLVDLKYWEGE